MSTWCAAAAVNCAMRGGNWIPERSQEDHRLRAPSGRSTLPAYGEDRRSGRQHRKPFLNVQVGHDLVGQMLKIPRRPADLSSPFVDAVLPTAGLHVVIPDINSG